MADVYVVESLGSYDSRVCGIYTSLEEAQRDYPGEWSPVGSANWERPRVAHIKYWISQRALLSGVEDD